MKWTDEELAKEFLEDIGLNPSEIFYQGVRGTLKGRVFTFLDILTACIKAPKGKENVAKELGLENGKQWDNLMTKHKWTTLIGKKGNYLGYRAFCANHFGYGFCIDCEDYLALELFETLKRQKYKTNSGTAEYRSRCIPHFNEYQRPFNQDWKKRNPHKVAENSARRRSWENTLYLEEHPEEAAAIQEFWKNKPEGYHVDHIIPRALGGSQSLDNLQYLPAKENLYKGALGPEEWKIKREKLVKAGLLEK